MIRTLILAIVLLVPFVAKAANLQNAQSAFCLSSSATQVACSNASSQDVIFEPQSGGKYRLKIASTGTCLLGASSAQNAAVTLATCSTAAGQLWTVYQRSGVQNLQFQSDLSTSGLPLCLGVQGDNDTASGTALGLVECSLPSVEWSTDVGYVRSQSASSTVPIYVISGSVRGARAAGESATAGAACTCSVFSKDGYCALVANNARAALCRPLAGRSSTGIVPLTVTTRPASDIPTPLTMALRTDLTDLNLTSAPLTMTSGQTLEKRRIRRAGGGECVRADGINNATIRDNYFVNCTTSTPVAGDDNTSGLNDRPIYANNVSGVLTITGNVIRNGSWGMYVQSAQAVVIKNNFIYNVLGPRWGGNGIQIGSITANTTQSEISCNKYHGRLTYQQTRAPTPQAAGTGDPTPKGDVEDKINIGGPIIASSARPLKIWNNRIIGPIAGGNSGSGIQAGDYDGTGDVGWFDIRYNRIAYTNGHGISIAGGHDHVIDSNIIDNRSPASPVTNTGPAMRYIKYNAGATAACTNLTISNNHGWAYQRYFGDTGFQIGLQEDASCTSVTKTGNTFSDSDPVLTGMQLFYDAIAACGE